VATRRADGQTEYDAAMSLTTLPGTPPHRPPALPCMLAALLVAACAPVAQAPLPTVVPPAAPRSAPPVAAPPSNASEVLSRGRAPFDACYTQARATRPDIGRTSVEITFTMDEQGKLLSVELQYRNRMDEGAKDCMRKAAEALKFPSLLYGTQVGTIQFAPPSP
jgi:hypothetical protein